MKTKRQYTKEFKEEAVQLAERSGSKIQVARDLGIHISLLGRWKRELQEGGKNAFPGNGKPRDEEMAQLRKENNRLKEEVEILKKAMGHRDAVSSAGARYEIPVYKRVQWPAPRWAIFYNRFMSCYAGIQKWLLCLVESS